MKEPPDLRELIGDDVPPDELESLRHTDSLLRSVPAPPAEVPASLAQAVARVPPDRAPWTLRRVLPALAFAAALAVLFFALGRSTGGASFDERYAVDMKPTRFARQGARCAGR